MQDQEQVSGNQKKNNDVAVKQRSNDNVKQGITTVQAKS